jgi:hypothetical protein
LTCRKHGQVILHLSADGYLFNGTGACTNGRAGAIRHLLIPQMSHPFTWTFTSTFTSTMFAKLLVLGDQSGLVLLPRSSLSLVHPTQDRLGRTRHVAIDFCNCYQDNSELLEFEVNCQGSLSCSWYSFACLPLPRSIFPFSSQHYRQPHRFCSQFTSRSRSGTRGLHVPLLLPASSVLLLPRSALARKPVCYFHRRSETTKHPHLLYLGPSHDSRHASYSSCSRRRT